MLPKLSPLHLISWDIVHAGARIEWLGSVEATDERDAIERAAKKFKTDLNKLLAVKRS
jgi:Ser/Thr protein kinase RdoA (MazF antagonist)